VGAALDQVRTAVLPGHDWKWPWGLFSGGGWERGIQRVAKGFLDATAFVPEHTPLGRHAQDARFRWRAPISVRREMKSWGFPAGETGHPMTSFMTMEHGASADVANYDRGWWILAVPGIAQIVAVRTGIEEAPRVDLARVRIACR
jgi:hypothetical protein